MTQHEVVYGTPMMSPGAWNPSRRCDPDIRSVQQLHVRSTDSSDSIIHHDQPYHTSLYDNGFGRSSTVYPMSSAGSAYGVPATTTIIGNSISSRRAEHRYSSSSALASGSRPPSGSFGSYHSSSSHGWDLLDRHSPTDSVDDIFSSPGASDLCLESSTSVASCMTKSKGSIKGRPQRRPSNRDEFDGPHQFLARPPPDYVAMQERELPHLPTNLMVQEQDDILGQVNDCLSRCAFDFVAKYQFPIPLTQDMRPVERPEDREWTEWVYLLKRLATKRRIPARVLYNGQIKQFVTILENSLEMRHAAKHQSRPLKDDRNVLQLISAGIQVAKILKDAPAMQFLDKLYVNTESLIRERSAAASARFR